jgi:hypothetical protein
MASLQSPAACPRFRTLPRRSGYNPQRLMSDID